MKSDILIFEITDDGIYSGISKVLVSKSFAKDNCDTEEGEYWLNFSKAKKELLRRMKERSQEWIEAIKDARGLKLSDVEYSE